MHEEEPLPVLVVNSAFIPIHLLDCASDGLAPTSCWGLTNRREAPLQASEPEHRPTSPLMGVHAAFRPRTGLHGRPSPGEMPRVPKPIHLATSIDPGLNALFESLGDLRH